MDVKAEAGFFKQAGRQIQNVDKKQSQKPGRDQVKCKQDIKDKMQKSRVKGGKKRKPMLKTRMSTINKSLV